jgi:hypothetical protein
MQRHASRLQPARGTGSSQRFDPKLLLCKGHPPSMSRALAGLWMILGQTIECSLAAVSINKLLKMPSIGKLAASQPHIHGYDSYIESSAQFVPSECDKLRKSWFFMPRDAL